MDTLYIMQCNVFYYRLMTHALEDSKMEKEINKIILIKFKIGIFQLIVKILLTQRSLSQIRHCLTEHNQILHHFLSKNILMTLKIKISQFHN